MGYWIGTWLEGGDIMTYLDVRRYQTEIAENAKEWKRLENLKEKYRGSNRVFSFIEQQHDLHKRNEKLRSYMGYSGGEDGSGFKITDQRRYNLYLGATKGISTAGNDYDEALKEKLSEKNALSVNFPGIDLPKVKGFENGWVVALVVFILGIFIIK